MEVLSRKTARVEVGSAEYQEREATVAQWLPLVDHVIGKRFSHLHGNDREEARQAGRIGLWQAIRNFRPGRASFKTYAFKYIWGTIRIHLRRPKRAMKFEAADRPMDSFPAVAANDNLGKKLMVWLAARVDEDRRYGILYRSLHGESYQTIGNDLGLSREWVRVLRKQAIERMQAIRFVDEGGCYV